MEDLRIYDFEFNLLHVSDRFISLNWSLYYNEIGTFEAHFDLADEIAPVILEKKYLVAVQGEKSAVITGVICGDDLAVYGRTCNWILTRRTVTDIEYMAPVDVQDTARALIQTAWADIFGKDKGLFFAPNAANIGKHEFSKSGCGPLFDAVRDCLSLDRAGHDIAFVPSEKKWVFAVKKGKEIPILVSEANKNTTSTEYSFDLLDYYSMGKYQKSVPGQEEGETQTVWESIVKDSSKNGIYAWECSLSGSVESEAYTELLSKKENISIAADSESIVYGKDYDLGDICRVQVVKGGFLSTGKKRITGVNIWYEFGNIGQQPIFESED